MLKLQKVEEQSNFFRITNEKNQSFQIGYWGCDLYWVMEKYDEDNLFTVSQEDKVLFPLIDDLFSKIEENDNPYDKLLVGNCFRWKSEAEGLPENAQFRNYKRRKWLQHQIL